jgi:hypothetical protein
VQLFKKIHTFKSLSSFHDDKSFKSFVWVISCVNLFLILTGPHRLNTQFSGDPDNFASSIVIHSILNLLLLHVLRKKNIFPWEFKQTKAIRYKIFTQNLSLVFTFAFLVWMSISYLWSGFSGSPLNPYLYLIQILFCGFLMSRLSRSMVISIFVLLFGLISCIIYLVLATGIFGVQVYGGDELNNSPDRYLVFSSGPNVWPRWIMFSVLGVLWTLLFRGIKQRLELTLLFILPPFAWLLILSGSRGIYLASTLSCIFMLFVARLFGSFSLFNTGKRWFFFLLGTLFAMAIEAKEQFPATKMFIFRVFNVTIDDKSASGRGQFLSEAENIFSENKLIGSGVGSYTQITGLDYPHNVFMETLATGGLVGFVILVLILWSITKLYLNSRYSSEINFKTNTFLFASIMGILVLQQFSGSMADARFLFWMVPFLKLGETTNLLPITKKF